MELVLIPEDFHSRENWWAQSSIATQFIQQFPLEEMKSMDELVNAKGAYCLAKADEVYVVYLPMGTKSSKLNLQSDKTFSVKWFSPTKGGALQNGSVSQIHGKGAQSLGNPPSEPEMDWVAVIQ